MTLLWGEWYDEQGVHKKRRPRRLGAVDRLKRVRYLSVDEFFYVKQKTNRIPKVTLPSPSLWANFWSRKYSGHVYPTLDAFLADIVGILRAEVAELGRRGATCFKSMRPTGILADPRTAFLKNGLGLPSGSPRHD
jgi:5-methyltetrahydropteroyltriglutamate--homocysteine methyltransferase